MLNEQTTKCYRINNECTSRISFHFINNANSVLFGTGVTAGREPRLRHLGHSTGPDHLEKDSTLIVISSMKKNYRKKTVETMMKKKTTTMVTIVLLSTMMMMMMKIRTMKKCLKLTIHPLSIFSSKRDSGMTQRQSGEGGRRGMADGRPGCRGSRKNAMWTGIRTTIAGGDMIRRQFEVELCHHDGMKKRSRDETCTERKGFSSSLLIKRQHCVL